MAKSPFKKDGMFEGASHLIFQMAKDLRKNMTDAEKLLWHHLKQNFDGFKFRRQHPLGIYIADFYCYKAKRNDEIRQRSIEQDGFTVIRFKNEEVFNNLGIVLQKIKSHLVTQ